MSIPLLNNKGSKVLRSLRSAKANDWCSWLTIFKIGGIFAAFLGFFMDFQSLQHGAFETTLSVDSIPSVQHGAFETPLSVDNIPSVQHGAFETTLSVDNIERWCPFEMPNCDCEDPLQPRAKEDRGWTKSHALNKQAAAQAGKLDVVFFGDSITFRWGPFVDQLKPFSWSPESPQIFQEFFGSGSTARYQGLALGAGGDRTSHLLYRLQNGELPDSLQPSVLWLFIGTNDLGFTWCSPPVVVLGIQRVVQELRWRKPDATIVVQGLLPRTYHPNGYVNRAGEKRKRPLPAMWTNIQIINQQLREYAQDNDNVEYFEANDVFFNDLSAGPANLQIDHDLMFDYLHPTPKGYKLLAKHINDKLGELLGGSKGR
jgi:lysophospholipase L1-like esterase